MTPFEAWIMKQLQEHITIEIPSTLWNSVVLHNLRSNHEIELAGGKRRAGYKLITKKNTKTLF